MCILIAISFIIFTAYLVCAAVKNHGLPESVSQTYYVFGRSASFFCWMTSVGFTLFPAWAALENYSWLAFLSIMFLTGVGTCPEYLSSQKVPHFCCAGLAAALTVCWIVLHGSVVVLSVSVLFAAMFSFIYKKQFLFWCEVSLFLAMYVMLFSAYVC